MMVDNDKPKYREMNLLVFQEQVRSEHDCCEWLFHTRWPNGFCCPACSHDQYTYLSTRTLYKCIRCGQQVSLTAGTIFHKTKTPLLKWFWLIFRMATSKTGVSIVEMQRELEIKDYKTVWVMAHKIRKAMSDRDAQYQLAGLVEIDESFFGPGSSGKRGRGAEKKALVLIAVSTWRGKDGKEQPGFAHAFVVEDASAETIRSVLNRLSLPEDQITPVIEKLRSDGWRSYQTVADDLGIAHYRVVLRDPTDSMKLLPWTHRVIAHAKAVMAGPHRGVSEKHLQRYLSEVCYRFNRRFWHKQSFHRLLRACISTTTITRDELMAP